MANSFFHNFHAMVVDSSTNRRMQIKSAASASGIIGEIELCKDFRFALENLNSGSDKVAIFLSEEFPRDSLTKFLTDAKQTPHGKNAAFILSVKTKDATQASVSTTLLDGFDGLLMEPFSVNAIVDIIQVAARVHQERTLASQEAAVKHLVVELLKTFDEVATLKATERPPGEKMKDLKEIAASTSRLEGPLLDSYYKVLIEESQKITPSPDLLVYLEKKGAEEARILERMKRQDEDRRAAIEAAKLKANSQRIIRKS